MQCKHKISIQVLNQCNYVVIDEADRMIDDDMEVSLYQVLDAIPSTNMKSDLEDEYEK